MRPLFLALLIAACTRTSGGSPLLVVENQLLQSPASANSAAPRLATSAAGSAYLCWIESGDNRRSLRFAAYDADKKNWESPRTIRQGDEIALDSASTPQISVNPDGALVAVWCVARSADGTGFTSARVSRSDDKGRTWSPPRPLTDENASTEFVSLAPLDHGRFLAAWLDGRDKRGSTGAQTLRSRILFSDAEEWLIDPRVCDCCATALSSFPDGSALAIYRDRAEDEIRDINVARFRDGTWSSPTKLSRENWRIEGCPVNGPAIASNGSHVAAAWFTAAQGQPAVYLSASASAGEPFLIPVRVDDGKAFGQVAVAVLREGTTFVTWVENAGNDGVAVWLRRFTPDGTLSVPVRLAVGPAHRLGGTPRLALIAEGPQSSAELLLAHTVVEGDVPHVSVRRISVAPVEPERNPCALCPPGETRGSAVHGYIRSVDTAAGTARVKHEDIPGVMPAMTMSFHILPEELAKLSPESEIFGRVERREDGWWLFSIRPVPSGPPQKSP